MNLIKKYALAISLLFLVMMAVLAYVMIQNMRQNLSRQYQDRLEAATQSVIQELSTRSNRIASQLRILAQNLSDDPDFRYFTVQTETYSNSYLIDYAGNSMQLMGLQLLDILNAEGRLISSGAERSTFGAMYPERLRYLRSNSSELKLIMQQGIRQNTLCLAQLDSFRYGPHKFFVIGGVEITEGLMKSLRGDTTEMTVLHLSPAQWISAAAVNASQTPVLQDSLISSGLTPDERYSVRVFELSLLDKRNVRQAKLLLFHPRLTLLQLIDAMRNSILLVMGGGLLVAVLIAVGLALTVTRPLKRLTDKAGALTLESLDVDFDVHRKDEIGVLNNALDRMIRRLRQNRVELSAAEQKGAFADIARQVNHDIKNGFIPIRNVMAHWEEVSRENPSELPKVFEERKVNVQESLDYLESLARRYSQLRPDLHLSQIDINKIITNLLKSYETAQQTNIRFQTRLDEHSPLVKADAIQLRRAFENVLRNAIEALPEGGEVIVSTEVNGSFVRITWTDSGSGIPTGIREQLFTAPVTTKPDGTGIGLANVKRIIDSFDGNVTIGDAQPQGTIVMIDLPAIR